MKKKGILLAAVILLGTAGLVQAQDQLGVTFDTTYVTRYIWRGFDLYGEDHSAIQPSINVDLWGTGWGFNVFMSRANGGGSYENYEEIDYTIYYGNTCWEGEPHQMNYTVGWMYYNYPDGPIRHATCGCQQDLDRQEVFGSFAWPNVCPWGVVPSYTVIRMWPDEGGEQDCGHGWSAFRGAGGWIHVFGLGYDWTVPGLLPDTAEQVLHLSYDMVYNDHTGGASVDHDWSHGVFGISTSVPINGNLTFTPGFYYQSSWDDSVNTSDEYWTSLGMSYALPTD